MLTDVKILRQAEDYDFQTGGVQRKGVRTHFTVGDDGPFSVFLADDKFSPDANLAAIEAKADAVRATRTSHTSRG